MGERHELEFCRNENSSAHKNMETLDLFGNQVLPLEKLFQSVSDMVQKWCYHHHRQAMWPLPTSPHTESCILNGAAQKPVQSPYWKYCALCQHLDSFFTSIPSSDFHNLVTCPLTLENFSNPTHTRSYLVTCVIDLLNNGFLRDESLCSTHYGKTKKVFQSN